ncbi:MAG: hypothetical protein WAU65_02060 [Candidatus Nanoarchaeia archaeon]
MPTEEDELEHQTCGALLLQFKEPKVYDLTIPDDYEIYSLVVIAGKILNGEKVDPTEVNCTTTRHHNHPLREEYFSNITKKVSKGLMSVLDESKEKNSSMYYYLKYMSNTLGHEFHIGNGDWFRFREGKRKCIEEEVRSYFSSLELCHFEKIGSLFRPYIGLTDSLPKVCYRN